MFNSYQAFLVRSRENVSCPICGGTLRYRDRCDRFFYDSRGDRKRLKIRRLHCTECHSLHRELPNIIMPFKHYSCSVIEAAIDSSVGVFCAEDNSIRRWQQWFNRSQVHFWGVLNSAATTTGSPLPQLFDRSGSLLRSIREHLRVRSGWLRQLVRITVNTHNWFCTELVWVTGD